MEEIKIKIQLLPEEKRGGLFLGRLPKPLLALAMLPAKEPLDTKSSRLVHLSDTVSSVVTPETPGTPGTASCVCFNDGDGLIKFNSNLILINPTFMIQ